jgi:hypothetical protein
MFPASSIRRSQCCKSIHWFRPRCDSTTANFSLSLMSSWSQNAMYSELHSDAALRKFSRQPDRCINDDPDRKRCALGELRQDFRCSISRSVVAEAATSSVQLDCEAGCSSRNRSPLYVVIAIEIINERPRSLYSPWQTRSRNNKSPFVARYAVERIGPTRTAPVGRAG